MTNHDPRDPIRRIAIDMAADITPMAVTVTGRPDFEVWSQVTGEFADDIERQLRREVDA